VDARPLGPSYAVHTSLVTRGRGVCRYYVSFSRVLSPRNCARTKMTADLGECTAKSRPHTNRCLKLYPELGPGRDDTPAYWGTWGQYDIRAYSFSSVPRVLLHFGVRSPRRKSKPSPLLQFSLSSLTWIACCQANSEFRSSELALPSTSWSSHIPRSCWFLFK
jgi:hypothetical protein